MEVDSSFCRHLYATVLSLTDTYMLFIAYMLLDCRSMNYPVRVSVLKISPLDFKVIQFHFLDAQVSLAPTPEHITTLILI